ncbi:MAG TPA: TlpA disulfide reductase family protein [Puia sp.]|nr:TlpA disulfide reductase family protein [Puia sp.]
MQQYSLFLLFLPASLTVSAVSAQQPFTLTGKISGHPEGMMRISYQGPNGKRVADSAKISNGAFAFHGSLDGPTMAYLYDAKSVGSMDDPNSTDLFIEPGDMTIALKQGSFKEAEITGSQTEADYRSLEASKKPIRDEEAPLVNQYEAANQAYTKAVKAKADDRTLDTLKYRAAAIHDQFDPYNDRMAELDYQFFAAHPQSYVTAFMLQFHTSSLTLDSLEMFYDRLGTALQHTSLGKRLADEVAMLKAGSPGSMAANFNKKDLHGKEVSLAKYRGKYVLLDFWASWCVPCRKSMPHVRELYNEYKDKGFAVIAISDDDNNPAAWQKAIEKDGTDLWPNVLRGLDWAAMRKGEKSPDDLDNKFGIHSLPTKILIDPSGKIIGRYAKGTEEEASELDAQLAKAFSK